MRADCTTGTEIVELYCFSAGRWKHHCIGCTAHHAVLGYNVPDKQIIIIFYV